MKNIIDWKVLFDVLMNVHTDKLSFQLEQSDTIVLSTFDKETADQVNHILTHNLKNRKTLYDSLSYQTGHETIPTPELTIPECPQTASDCLKLFECLLGGDTFEESEISSLFTTKCEVVNGIFYSKIYPSKTQQIQQAKLNYFMACFNKVTREDIRQAWTEENYYLPKPEADNPLFLEQSESTQTNNLTIQGKLKNWCGFIENKEKNTTQAFINTRQFYQLIYPPLFLYQETARNKVTEFQFKLDATHFYSYLSGLVMNDMLLRVTQGPEEEINARPIFFGKDLFDALPSSEHILIIDRSGSMHTCIDTLNQRVKEYIEQLYHIDQKATVKLVYFNGTRLSKSFTYSQQAEINQYLSTIQADGGTAIFDTVITELKSILNNKGNQFISIFTDGKDTESKYTLSDLKKLTNTFSPQQKDRIQIFTFGLGACDTNTLTHLAQVTGSEYRQLKSKEDFLEIKKALTSNRHGRKLIELIYLLEGKEQTIDISVPNTQSPHAANLVFALNPNQPVPIIVQGNTIKISVNDKSLIRKENKTDQLARLASKVSTLAIQSTNATLHQDINELEAIKQQIVTIKNDNTLSAINFQYADGILDLVTENVRLLKDKKTADSRMQQSINTRIQSRNSLFVSNSSAKSSSIEQSPLSLETKESTSSSSLSQTSQRKNTFS